MDSQIVDNAPPRVHDLPPRDREVYDDEEEFYAQLGDREDVFEDEL